jgi:hypothetical protein
VCSPRSDVCQICTKNFEEYRDISKNFLCKDGIQVCAQWIHYFVTVPQLDKTSIAYFFTRVKTFFSFLSPARFFLLAENIYSSRAHTPQNKVTYFISPHHPHPLPNLFYTPPFNASFPSKASHTCRIESLLVEKKIVSLRKP